MVNDCNIKTLIIPNDSNLGEVSILVTLCIVNMYPFVDKHQVQKPFNIFRNQGNLIVIQLNVCHSL